MRQRCACVRELRQAHMRRSKASPHLILHQGRNVGTHIVQAQQIKGAGCWCSLDRLGGRWQGGRSWSTVPRAQGFGNGARRALGRLCSCLGRPRGGSGGVEAHEGVLGRVVYGRRVVIGAGAVGLVPAADTIAVRVLKSSCQPLRRT